MKTRIIQHEPDEPSRDTPSTGRRTRGVLRRHPVVAFFVLSYALTWALVPLGVFNASGPLIAALITIAFTQGRPGFRALGSRMLRWRVGWGWYAVALGLPLAVHLITVVLNLMLGAPAPSMAQVTPWSAVLLVFAVRLINPMDGPMGEEPGWRGFALPHLQAARSPLAATTVLAPLVALWHVPLLLPEYGLRPIDLVGVLAGTVFFVWLFNRTGGSVLLPIAAHAAEGSIQIEKFWAGGAAEARVRVLYVLVWCLVAIGLLVFDRKTWRRPAPVPAAATAPPAPRPAVGTPTDQAAGRASSRPPSNAAASAREPAPRSLPTAPPRPREARVMTRLARTSPPMETAHHQGRSAMSTSPITRWAGRISLAAATLILTSQLLNLALFLTLGDQYHATLTYTLQFALALLAQYVLLLALTGLYTRQATAVGTLGLVGYLVAFLGGLLVAGDWWYEAFVGPQIANHAPQLVDMPRGASMWAGAIATATSFSLGWVLFGIATLRGRLLPAGPAILMIIGGAVAVLVLDTPYQIPLAIAVGWMGYRLNAVPHDQHEAPAPAPANP